MERSVRTELENLIEELRSTLGKMELALSAIGNAIVWTNRDGMIQWCNTSFDRLVSQLHIQVIGKTLIKLLPLHQKGTLLPLQLHPAHLALNAQAGMTAQYQFQAGPSPLELEISWTRVKLGAEESLMFVIQDITERKRADERIAQLNKHLQDYAAQLEIANKELEAFCYSVSHDLRAPLRHIYGFAMLLNKHAASNLDEEALQFLQTISNETKIMGVLIDDLLALSRVGRAALHIAEVNTRELVEEVVKNLAQETKERIIHWKIDPLPNVQADQAMLRIVLFNLIANAVKYTNRRAEACIHIGSLVTTPDEIVIFIKDNGVGFDMKYVDKLFGVFQRLHSSDEFEGTGIGLANVKRILSRHGGRTWAEGAVDQGATFYFALPAQPVAPQEGGAETGRSSQ